MANVRLGAGAVLSAVLALLAVPCAAAGTATNQMPVSLTIPAGCEVVTRPLDFGTVTVSSLPVDSTSVITLRCAPGTGYSVQLDNGLYATGTQRRMYAGPVGSVPAIRYVSYNLYRDAGRSQLWTSAIVASGTAPANGLVDLTVYGRMPVNVVLPTGYTDSVTVTVNF